MKTPYRSLIVTLLITIILASNSSLHADFSLSRLFSHNMVLQQNREVPVWGWADQDETIEIQFNGKTYHSTPDSESGKWMIHLEPLKAGGPYSMIVSGKDKETEISNILVGEVWICSGQSNMEWRVRNSNDAEEEIANGSHPRIRHFDVPNRISGKPLDTLDGGSWEMASPDTVGDFSAVAYYFARELQKERNVPVGLINATWGGTLVETWIQAEAIKTIDEFTEVVEELQTVGLENLAKAKFEDLQTKLGGHIPEEDIGMQDGEALFARPDFNRDAWATMEIPSRWENGELPYFDGVVWHSKTIHLDEIPSTKNGEAILNLDNIDDTDITWINGIKVGETDGFLIDRKYAFSTDILKKGANVIVVRVEDRGGFGGIRGAEEMFLEIGDKKIPLAGQWNYKVGKGTVGPEDMFTSPNSKPTLLYNGMVHALIPYAIQGTIWYQGESNAGNPPLYQKTFPRLINNWRNLWDQGDFPFLWVQLANFRQPDEKPSDSDWAGLREAQTKTLSLPNTGQAVIIDIGEADDIHPRNKQDVGLRLSLAARKVAYNEDIVYSSPMFESMEVEDHKARIKFDHVGQGLVTKNKYGYVNGFALAGEDGKFYWAKAKITAEDEVLAYSKQVDAPVHVRYGWGDNPDDLNLYNSANLPACPFRTGK